MGRRSFPSNSLTGVLSPWWKPVSATLPFPILPATSTASPALFRSRTVPAFPGSNANPTSPCIERRLPFGRLVALLQQGPVRHLKNVGFYIHLDLALGLGSRFDALQQSSANPLPPNIRTDNDFLQLGRCVLLLSRSCSGQLSPHAKPTILPLDSATNESSHAKCGLLAARSNASALRRTSSAQQPTTTASPFSEPHSTAQLCYRHRGL